MRIAELLLGKLLESHKLKELWFDARLGLGEGVV